MFSLVQFDDETYFITTSRYVNILEDKDCLVKFRGARYHAVLISTCESKETLELLRKSLQYKPVVVINSIDVDSNVQELNQKAADAATETSRIDTTYEIHGIGNSTPINEEIPSPRDQLTLSSIKLGNCSGASSAAPSGCTDILDNMGDDWLKDSDQAYGFEDVLQLPDSNSNYAINLNHNSLIQIKGTISKNKVQDNEKEDNLDEQNNNVEHIEYIGYANEREGNNQSRHNNNKRYNEVQKDVGQIQDNEQEDNKEVDDVGRNNEIGKVEKEVSRDIEQNYNKQLDGIQIENGIDGSKNIGEIQDELDDEEVNNVTRDNEVGGEEREVGGYVKQNHNKQLDNLQEKKESDGDENIGEIQGNRKDDDKEMDDVGRKNGEGEVGGESSMYIEQNDSRQHDDSQVEEASDGEVSNHNAGEFENDDEWQNEKEEQNEEQDHSSEETSDDDAAKDSSYVPGSSFSNITFERSQLNSTEIISKSFIAGPAIDSRSVNVPPSKSKGTRPFKKYFCPFCKKLQTKFARHLELKHKSEADVKRFMKFPKGNYERAKIIETIRKYGNFLHNTNRDLNTGILITCRRRQPKYERAVEDYVCCSNCKGFFSKQTLRLHFNKCNITHKKGVRDILVMGRRLTGYIHEAASKTLRHIVVPVMRDDEVTRSFQYDELLIVFGNKLCDKYSAPHEHDMIRAQLRLLSRFKSTIKDINPKIDDFASIFHPAFYDSVVSAVRRCANFDPKTGTLKTPAVASTLGTLLKKCVKLRQAECIKKQDYEGKQAADDFLVLFEDDFPISVNKKVVEAQMKQKRQQKIILPSKEDIRRLYDFLKKECEASMKILEIQFESSAWKTLSECTLISVQMFNRRRAGEIERLLVTDFQNRAELDENVDPDLYRKLSNEARKFAKQFARLTIRGKLGRTVPVILNPFHVSCIETIFKYRSEAGVESENEFIFSIPSNNPTKKKYLRACELMRRFSHECGAVVPSSLRGTTLRKHIATFFAMEGLGETEVADLANFMGHNQQIHKDIYRVPIAIREVAHVSRLRQQAIGYSEEEEGGGAISESEESNAEIPLKQINRHDASIEKSVNTSDNVPTTESKNSSDTSDTENKSITKRRSTSPYGKTKRVRWSNQEKNAVRKIFGDPTTIQKLPSLNDCQQAIENCKLLRNRKPQMLKTWIDNQRKALSRRRVSQRDSEK